VTARRAPKNLFRVGDPAARRSASDQVAVVVCVRLEFFFACADARVVSCIHDPTDVAGLMGNMTISGPSVRFLIVRAWRTRHGRARPRASQMTRFLICRKGLGELEIKPETLRFLVCTTRDFVADSSINVENWVITKASEGFRRTTSNATAWSLHNALCYPQLSARLVDCGQDT